MSKPGAHARRMLIVSPWETVWSLAGDEAAPAGVSDDNRFIDGLTRAGWDLHFLRPRTAQRDARVTTHFYPNFFRATRGLPTALRRALWPLLFNAVVLPRAVSLARTLDPDVVLGHSHYATLASWLCRRRTRAAGVVKLFGVMDLVHLDWPRARYWFKNFEQLVALKFPQDAWIVLDDGTRGDEALRARGIPADRVHFLPNGIDLEWAGQRADRAQSRARFELPAGACVVLYLARLVASKRPIDVVRAAAALPESVHVVIAGAGPERTACERAARELGVATRVHFTGAVPHDDVPLLMAAADIFVSTGTMTNRGLPTCEAMLCGVPAVTYDTGDTATLIQSGVNGVLVPDGNVDALSRAISDLASDAQRRTRLADAGRETARRTFVSWEARVAREIHLFEALMAGRSV